jgi:hypothetical protein
MYTIIYISIEDMPRKKAIDVCEEEFDTEIMGIRKALRVDENQINAVQRRLEMDEEMIWKIIDGFKALK